MYEELPVPDVRACANLLARVLIAKVADEARLRQIIRSTPLSSDPAFRCRDWAANVMARLLHQDSEQRRVKGRAALCALATRPMPRWEDVERTALAYVGRKEAEGRYRISELAPCLKPTWDMLTDKELIA